MFRLRVRFYDNDSIKESWLNYTQLHRNKKGTQRLTRTIWMSLDVLYTSASDIGFDITKHSLSTTTPQKLK